MNKRKFIADNFTISIENISKLNAGSMATVFDIGNHEVIKVTSDLSDIDACFYFKKHPSDYIVDIKDIKVHKLGLKSYLGFIRAERLNTRLNNSWREFFDMTSPSFESRKFVLDNKIKYFQKNYPVQTKWFYKIYAYLKVHNFTNYNDIAANNFGCDFRGNIKLLDLGRHEDKCAFNAFTL